MNVLQTIKGALNNAQQVGSSIKSLKPNKKSPQLKTYADVEGVDINAGADLLNKFHEQWSDMHHQVEHNAKAAQKVDGVLRSQYARCEQQTEVMNHLMSLSSTLPHLLADITRLIDTIAALQEQFQYVESALATLVDVGEALEMRGNQRHHYHQLADYTTRKAAMLEHVKAMMADDHTKRVDGYEAKLQEHLRVKQEAFEEAFAKEMQNYRESGSTDMRPLLSRSAQNVELSDIAIEQDNSALDAFLDSDDGTTESSTATATLEDDDDDDEEDNYINVGIISNDISDPEIDDGLIAVVSEQLQVITVKEHLDAIKTNQTDFANCTDTTGLQNEQQGQDETEKKEDESKYENCKNGSGETK